MVKHDFSNNTSHYGSVLFYCIKSSDLQKLFHFHAEWPYKSLSSPCLWHQVVCVLCLTNATVVLQAGKLPFYFDFPRCLGVHDLFYSSLLHPSVQWRKYYIYHIPHWQHKINKISKQNFSVFFCIAAKRPTKTSHYEVLIKLGYSYGLRAPVTIITSVYYRLVNQ